MKPTTILSTSAILVTALASTAHPNVHAVADLVARAMDPATMNPTKVSVLSVLKTAMPTSGTGTDIVLPTGTVMPQWYKDLPAEIMVLLAQMYPATTAGSAESGTSATSASASAQTGGASQSTLTRTLELVGSSATAGSSGTQTDANATLSTGQPSPTQSALSTGAKNSVGIGRWSLAMGMGVAAGFCFFA